MQLPGLETFQYDPLETIPLSDSLTTSIHSGDQESIGDVEVDIWIEAGSDDISSNGQLLKTWERFYNRTFKEPSVYFTEAGPCVFDAALLHSSQSLQIQDGGHGNRPILQDPMLKSFIQLGMGRQSSMFGYRAKEHSFHSRYANIRVSGYTLQSLGSLTTVLVQYGNQLVKLRSFVEDAYRQGMPSTTYIAVATAISSILSTLLDHISGSSKSVHSFLQLQSIFELPRQLVNFLSEMVAKMSDINSDAAILSNIYLSTQELEYTDARLRPVALQIFSFVSQPWLESVECCMGLQAKNPAGLDILLLEEPENIDGSSLDRHDKEMSMPTFIGAQDRRTIMQTWQSLTLLEANSSDHVLLKPNRSDALRTPKLEWHFGWGDIERIEANAKQYEANVLMAMSSKHLPQSATVDPPLSADIYDYDPFNVSKEDLQIRVSSSYSLFEEPSRRGRQTGGCDSLQQCLNKTLSEQERHSDYDCNEGFAPPLSLAPLLCFSPIMSVQARLLNLACLRLLFEEHSLRSHLRLQHRFQLFGDGVFRSRLSHALFDLELGSAERRKGHTRAGKMGLKLGSRDSWPPASSELRLALMGILSESYKSIHVDGRSLGLKSGDLPGGLSFAIRDISDEEIQKCMNPNSVEALDFLRLQYKAPAPLDSVITAQCLDKYDIIFKLLLRMTRMLFVVNQLSRSGKSRARFSQSSISIDIRFRFEAQHFVSAICEYYFNVAVSSIWNQFEDELVHLEQQIQKDDTAYEISSLIGIHELRKRHEQVLDDMMFALLLQKRHEQVMKHLEEILGSILLFAKADSNGLNEENWPRSSSKIEGMYHTFKDKVRDFIAICVGLSRKPDHGAANHTILSPKSSQFNRHGTTLSEGNGIAQLLLKLQMNGYYSMP